MKKLNLLAMMFVVFVVVTLVISCSKDDTTTNTTKELSLIVTDGIGATYAPGTSVNYDISITSGIDLKSLTLTATVGGISQTPISIFSSNGTKTYKQTYNYAIPNDAVAGSKISLVFTITDSNGGSKVLSKEFIVNSTNSSISVFNVNEDASVTYTPNTTVSYDVSITSSTTLKTLTLISTVNGISSNAVAIFSTNSNTNYHQNYAYTIPADAVVGSKIILLFTATATDNSVRTITKEITVKDGSSALTFNVNDDVTATYVANTNVTYGLTISSPTTLKKLSITANIGGVSQTPFTVFSSNVNNNYNQTYDYTIPSTATVGSKIILVFTITDNSDRVKTIVKEITVQAATSSSLTFNVNTDALATYTAGSSVNYGLVISSTNTIQKVSLTANVAGTEQSPITIASNAGNSYNQNYVYTIPSAAVSGSTITLVFTVTDNNTVKTVTKVLTVANTIPIAMTVNSDITATYYAGSTVNYNIICTSGTTLKSLTVTQVIAGVTFSPITIFDSNTNTACNQMYAYTIPITANEGSKIALTFTITDLDGKTGTVTEMITVKANTPLTSYPAVTLGASESTYPSYFSAATGLGISTKYNAPYISTDAASTKVVDFIFYYGTTNNATLCAPSNMAVEAFTSIYAVTTWATRNQTQFVKLNTFDFTNATEATLTTAAASATFSDQVTQLVEGDIIIFKTASTSSNPNKLGVVKVGNINKLSGSATTTFFASTINFTTKIKATAN